MEKDTNELVFLNEGLDLAGNATEVLENEDCNNFLVYVDVDVN